MAPLVIIPRELDLTNALFSVYRTASHPAGPHDVPAISLTRKRDGKAGCVPA